MATEFGAHALQKARSRPRRRRRGMVTGDPWQAGPTTPNLK
jgi:hypothetical protein